MVWISWDTTRADALGCYAEQAHWRDPEGPRPVTPTADGLARDGVRFAWATAPAPTTLSSHTAVFSGLDSHGHRVVRNGYPVPPDIALFPEALQRAGWQTVAVVGSSALESKMGLDRGFDVYDEPPEPPPGGMALRSGSAVTEAALAQVARADPSRPLFLFVHYYDAHTPWVSATPEQELALAPEREPWMDGSMAMIARLTERLAAGALTDAERRAARGLYLAQVQAQDAFTGELLAGLSPRLQGNALVALFADHGETLDDNPAGPYTHGPWVRLVDTHVPLVLRGYGDWTLPASVPQAPARLLDLATTTRALIGLGGTQGSGIDLAPRWQGEDEPGPPSFAEATKPIPLENQAGWNNLPFERHVVLGDQLVRATPWQGGEVTVEQVAPGAPAVDDSAAVEAGIRQLRAWDAQAPAFRPREYDAATLRALQSLGYLEGE